LALVAICTVRAQSPQSPTEHLKQLADRGADQILKLDKPWTLLGQGYQLTADSAVDKDGTVYFTDARNNRILKIDLDGKISTWKQSSNGTHGLTIGPDGRLYGGQHDRKRIVAFSRDGTESVVAEGMQTHHLTATSRKEIYFAAGPTHKVWFVDAAGHTRAVFDGIDFPRGIRASADRSVLVVNDAKTGWVWKFRIQPDGSLADGRTFCRLEAGSDPSGPDPGGMVFDSEGLLYVASKIGIQVCDPQGRVIALMNIPGNEGATNVFFGGPGLAWLYVTDGDRIYRRPVQRHGTAL
jgi:sugar lactone lactonase YvrE